MGTVASDNGGKDFPQAPAGTHLAICYMVVDIGQQETHFGMKPKIVIGWELPFELMEDGRPFAVSGFYTLSLSEKANLRKDLEAWRTRPFTEEEVKGFDVKNVLGKPCQVTIIHNLKDGKTRASVAGVAGVPKGADGKFIQAPAAKNELLYFDMDNPDKATLDKLPEWIKKQIASAANRPKDMPVDYSTAPGADVPF